ncbi:MAG: hypothetical protein INQ03_19410 [Candidatus Heimdallarchaeota archaeon]|nr:hypothetical protein [Candidatus Heimdallarchaeota archaeon]
MVDFAITKDEIVQNSVNVWAFEHRYLWLTLLLTFGIYFLPISILWKVCLYILLLWYGSYTIRQRWRLTLTNKRIVARRLYPRPLTYLSRSFNFPFEHIEGMSKGPKANILGFVLGLLTATNLGINLIRGRSFYNELELPDSISFIFWILQFIPFLKPEEDFVESQLEAYYQDIASDVIISLGYFFLAAGVLLILISYPWRETLLIRIRNAADFKLKASIPRGFVRQAYLNLYGTSPGKIPKRYERWDFGWFKGEKIDGIADMDQNLYLLRIVSSFGLITTVVRTVTYFGQGIHIFSQNFFFYVLLTSVDILTIIYGVKFAKYSHEMIITNKRIIFAQEMSKISGILGKRFFFISDLKRDDIAGFEFQKVNSLNLEYLGISLILAFSSLYLSFAFASFIPVILLVTAILLLFLVNQTYIKFILKTKCGDKWVMRHQLANPLTTLRRYIGDESSLFGKILTNRLEEKEIIQIMQILRSRDIKLPVRDFGKVVNRAMFEYQEALHREQGTDITEIQQIRANTIAKKHEKLLHLRVEDLLLVNEPVIWKKSVDYPIRLKTISIFCGSLILIIFYLIISNNFLDPVLDRSYTESSDIFGIPILTLLLLSMLTILLWLKFYSLQKVIIRMTPNRIFFEHRRHPPRLFYLIGINRETTIYEALLTQIQNITAKKNYVSGHGARLFLTYMLKTLISLIILVLLTYFREIFLPSIQLFPRVELVLFLFTFLIIFTIIRGAWSFGNGIIELIQSFPTISMTAEGIGIRVEVPYLSLVDVAEAQKIIWTGVLIKR